MSRRLALIAFGLVAALVAAELLVLQAGALVVRMRGREEPAAFETGDRRIIAVGDSHTYGLYLEREQAYPAQLQQQWDTNPELPRIEVLNLGVPGTNSSKLRANFTRILATFRPDTVLVMIGSNDGWTVPVAVPDARQPEATPAPATTAERLWEQSRVFRLLYMLAQGAQERPAAPKLSVDFQPPGSSSPKGVVRYGEEEIDLSFTQPAEGNPDWTNSLAGNLRAMVEAARAAGVQVVLMTYPTDYVLLGETNYVIRAVADQTRAPLVDLSKTMAAACRQDCGNLYKPDFHCTAQGNEIVARAVREKLTPLVTDAERDR